MFAKMTASTCALAICRVSWSAPPEGNKKGNLVLINLKQPLCSPTEASPTEHWELRSSQSDLQRRKMAWHHFLQLLPPHPRCPQLCGSSFGAAGPKKQTSRRRRTKREQLQRQRRRWECFFVQLRSHATVRRHSEDVVLFLIKNERKKQTCGDNNKTPCGDSWRAKMRAVKSRFALHYFEMKEEEKNRFQIISCLWETIRARVPHWGG